MMYRWIVFATGAAMLGGALMATTPAFAASKALTIDYVGVNKAGTTVTVKVSGLIPSSKGATKTVEFYEAAAGTTKLPVTGRKVRSGWTPIGKTFSVGTGSWQIFTEPLSDVTNYVSSDVLGVVEYNPGGNPMATNSTNVPLSPLPYGQLPEVPFAAAIPVVGIGAAVFLRRKRSA